MRKLLCLLPVLFLAGGCAVGVKHDYRSQSVSLAAETEKTVAVATLDNRPYVRNGEKSSTFVGLSRGGFGNPFDVNTESGQPLAADITATVAKGLHQNGVDVVPVETSSTDSTNAVLDALRATGAERSMLITLHEWKADTYAKTRLYFNVVAEVYGPEGDAVAVRRFRDDANLGGSGVNPPAYSRQAVPVRFRRQIEEIFSDPEIAAALK